MKRFLYIWLSASVLMAGLTVTGFGEKVATLDEVGKPDDIQLGNGYIYIREKTTIHIYDVNNFKYIKKFGKEGEGPEEIKANAMGGPISLTPANGKIYISSFAKVSIFSKSGEYIKEYKVKPFDIYIPCGDNYVMTSQTKKSGSKNDTVLGVFYADSNLKKKKLLYESGFEVGPNFKWKFPLIPFYPYVVGDKIFIIAGEEGFAIKKFNSKGDPLGKIVKKFKAVPVTKDYIKKTKKWFMTDPNFKNGWEFFKARIGYHDKFPAIYFIFTGENRLYAFTCNVDSKGMREVLVMDFDGKVIKKTQLYSPELYGMDFRIKSNIYKNYYYWILENDEEESWELHRQRIE